MLSKDETYRARIIRALNDVDIDITGYRYDEENHELYTQRMIDGKIYELRFNEESDGTKKMIAALPVPLQSVNWFKLAGVVVGAIAANLIPAGIAAVNAMIVAAVFYFVGFVVVKDK